MTKQIIRREWEELSAYLDEQLAPRERARLEKSLQARADLRAELAELKRTRMLLRSQPAIRSPRNFILTRAMAGAQRAEPTPRGVFQAMRLASVMASALFVLVVIGDVFFASRLSSGAPMIADTRAVQQFAQPVEEAAVEEAPMPGTESAELPQEMYTQDEAERSLTETGTPEAGMTMALPTMALPAGIESLAQPSYPFYGGQSATATPPIYPGFPQAPADELKSAYPAAEEPPPSAPQQDIAPGAEATAPLEEAFIPGATAELEAEAAEVVESATATPGFWTIWRFIEVSLLAAGVITGAIALYLWRTGRA